MYRRYNIKREQKYNEIIYITTILKAGDYCNDIEGFEIKDGIRIINSKGQMWKFAIWIVKKGIKWEFNFDPTKELPYLRPEIIAENEIDIFNKLRKVHPTAKIIFERKQGVIL